MLDGYTMARPKAYSYTRFSTPEQAKGDSARRQAEMAKAAAERHGLELDEELSFDDRGVSAFRGKNAKAGALQAFRRAVEDGEIEPGSWLIVENLDRLSREAPLNAMNMLSEIVSHGITVATPSDGQIYTPERLRNDSTALLMVHVSAMRANEESRMKARRLSAAWSAKRDRAGDTVMTRKGPAWLSLSEDRSVWSVDGDKAEVVRRIFTSASGGMGQQAIAASLNRDGVATFGKAERWQKSYVSKILRNPAVVGTFVPHKMEEAADGRRVRVPQKPVESYFPAVVSVEHWQAVHALLATTGKRRTAPSATIKNPFAGLARCHHCGSTLTRLNKGGGYATLQCTSVRDKAGCKARYIPLALAWYLFQNDVEYIAARVTNSDEEDEAQRLEEEIDIIRGEIENLVEALAGGHSPAIKDRLDRHEVALREAEEGHRALMQRMGSTNVNTFERAREALIEAALVDDFPATNAALRTLRVKLSFERDESGMASMSFAQE